MPDGGTPVARTRARPVNPVSNEPEAPSEFDALCAQIDKTHGAGVIETADKRSTFKCIPTNIFALDFALGGGIPEGLCTMIYGWPSGGKTMNLLRIIGQAQQKYPRKWVVMIDTEGTFDPEWAQVHGVNLQRLKIVQPTSGEQAADITCAALQALDVSLVALDSVPMLIPMNEMEDNKGNAASFEDAARPGGGANLITRFLRKANFIMTEERKRGHWPTLVLINQWRTKIGVMHGDPRTLPGGNSLNYVASVKVEMKNKEIAGKDARGFDIVVKNEHAFTIHKNKVINGARTGEFDLIRDPADPRGVGFIDEARTIIVVARKFDLVTGGGSSWRIDGVDERFGSLAATADYLDQNPDFALTFKRRLITMQREAVGKHGEWY